MRTDESRVLRKAVKGSTMLYGARDTSGRGAHPIGTVGEIKRHNAKPGRPIGGGHFLADGTDIIHPPQINIRADEELHADIDEISHDARITNRSDAIRYAVRKEAQRIRRRRKADK